LLIYTVKSGKSFDGDRGKKTSKQKLKDKLSVEIQVVDPFYETKRGGLLNLWFYYSQTHSIYVTFKSFDFERIC